MKNFKKLTIFCSLTVLLFSFGMINIDTRQLSHSQNLSQAAKSLLTMVKNGHIFKQAEAVTIIDANQEHMVRFLYFLINGPGPNGYPPGMGGPDGGFLGMIREITGPDALGGGLAASGYSTCASVPATGSATMTDADGTFTMYFETPVKTIPTGYTGAGSAFDKRVVVQFNGTTFMNIEFNCDTTVGWMRMAMGDSDTDMLSGTLRHIEVYWDTQTNSDAKLELYMTNEPDVSIGKEYFVAKFQTLSSSTYKFWIVRSQNKTGEVMGFRVAAYGDTSSNNVNAFLSFENGTLSDTTATHNDGGDISAPSGDVQCIDYSDPTTPVAGSDCGSLTLTDAGAPISNSGTGLSINWVGDAAGGLKNDMTALADPTNP